MRNGIAISSLLHVSVVVAVIYGLPDLLNEPIVLEQPVIVELVTISEKTTSQKPIEPSPKKAPPPAPKLKPIATPEPEPEPPVAKAPPPPPAATLEPVAAPTPPPPEPAKAKPKPPEKMEKPVQVAVPKPKPAAKSVEKPKPPKQVASTTPPKAFRTLPRPKAKPKRKRRQFNTNRIAALLDKDHTKKETEAWQKPKKSKAAKPIPRRANPVRTQARAQPMTMSEIDAIRYQIQQCWTISAGARGAENLVVKIKVFLNTDGTLAKAPEIVGSNLTGDPFYRTAAESARRAVLKCSPLKNLPADKYSRWRELTLTFNPREMLGG